MQFYPQDKEKPLFPLYLCQVAEWAALNELVFPSEHFIMLLLADYESLPTDKILHTASQLISKGLCYICCWGPKSDTGERYFDTAYIEQQPSDKTFLSTSHHEPLVDEALWYALYCAHPANDLDSCSTVIVNVANIAPQEKLEEYLQNLPAFNQRMLI